MPGSWGNRSADGKQRTSCFASFLIKGDVDCPTIDIDGNGFVTTCCTDTFTSGAQFNTQLGKQFLNLLCGYIASVGALILFFILFDCFAIGRKTAAISRVAKQSNSCHSIEQNKLMGKAAANFVCIIY